MSKFPTSVAFGLLGTIVRGVSLLIAVIACALWTAANFVTQFPTLIACYLLWAVASFVTRFPTYIARRGSTILRSMTGGIALFADIHHLANRRSQVNGNKLLSELGR